MAGNVGGLLIIAEQGRPGEEFHDLVLERPMGRILGRGQHQPRRLYRRIVRGIGDRFQRLATHDLEALRTFMGVMHMVESPAALGSPRMLLKVLTSRPPPPFQAHAPVPMAIPRSQAA